MIPIVSVVMANHNGARHLSHAIQSVLAQSLRDVELLIVDDASTDDSVLIGERFAAVDSRVRIHRLAQNSGPGAARNHALALARADWIAVVDSDDIIHPQRLQRLVSAAEADAADIIADDMVVFDDAHVERPRRLLKGARATTPSWITPGQYIEANQLLAKGAVLGYLKPLIRKSALSAHGIQYDESLRIAEDYDLILRLLVRGARFRLLPELLYFYRRHSGSISHRLSQAALDAMIASDARLRSWAGEPAIAALRPALDARIASIRTAGAAEGAIASLKARRVDAAVKAVMRHPAAIPIVARLLAPSRLISRMRRRFRRPLPQPTKRADRPVICVLSRQRLTDGTSGSGAYLLSLCRALHDSGFALHLISPSPAMLGRVPIVRIAGDGDIFERVVIRGTQRIGDRFVALDPLVYLHAAIGIADRMARRMGIVLFSGLAKPAPYAVGLPWTPEDLLFVAAEARGQADAIFVDYCFLTPGIPFVLRPDAPSAVLMHDLFSSRAATFAALGAKDSAAAPEEAEEIALLSNASTVIAIQQDEAAAVRRLLPGDRAVIVANMAVETVPRSQPGEGDGLLFVGSSAAANVDAMHWFLRDVLPLIRTQYPAARLSIAGTVCTALTAYVKEPGVTLLGRVADLVPLYRKADVVISPLRAGSGLKIKLIEALSHGKPIVATSITTAGVADKLHDAVAVADDAASFAASVVQLLRDPQLRRDRADAALSVARHSFSAKAVYADAIAIFHAPRDTSPEFEPDWQPTARAA